jgi:hypothetical protein
MNARLFIIAALAVLASAPVLAQYPGRMNAPPAQPPTQPPALPQPVPEATPAPVPTPAPSSADAPAPLPEIPAHHCVAPEYPGALASNTKVVVFNRDYKKYADCIKAYVDQNRAWISKVVEINNKAVEEYNQFTVELKKQIDSNKE